MLLQMIGHEASNEVDHARGVRIVVVDIPENRTLFLGVAALVVLLSAPESKIDG